MSIELIESTASSLTVSWPPTDGAVKYVLEYKPASDGGSDDGFQLLSDKLHLPQARKRNLEPGMGYFFRAGAVMTESQSAPDSWATHDTPFLVLTAEQEQQCLAAPTVSHPGIGSAAMVSWDSKEGATSYELQMRENQGGAQWKTISAALATTSARKKNLTSALGYQFRVRVASSGGDDYPFSPASEVIVARQLSAGMERFFESLEKPQTLLRSGVAKPVALSEALGGKEFVLLYASAHWCPPCRKFTPMLANWYQQVKNSVEVVFLSCDHDEAQFKNYFATHPWMAVDFDDDARDQLLAKIRVQGIPRLVVLSAKTGKILVDNAVGQQLDIGQWRTLDV